MGIKNMIAKRKKEFHCCIYAGTMCYALSLLFLTILMSESILPAAEDPISRKKILIIDSISRTAVGKGNKINMEDVYQQVAKHMPLDEAEDTEEVRSLIRKWEMEAKQQYPLSDSELRKQYRERAKQKYPLYKIGDQVSIVFLLHGKHFPVSGIYYKSSPDAVWVGSKRIARNNLPPVFTAQFDPRKTEKLRKDYVEKNVQDYFMKRKLYVEDKKKRDDAYQLSRGNIRFMNKWISARKLTAAVVEKYVSQAKKELGEKVSEAFRQKSLEEVVITMISLLEEYKDTIYASQINQLCIQVNEKYFNEKLDNICQTKYETREDENLKAMIQALRQLKKQYRNTSFEHEIDKKIQEKQEELRSVVSKNLNEQLNNICRTKYEFREDENLKAVIQALRQLKKQYRNTSFEHEIDKKIQEKQDELQLVLE